METIKDILNDDIKPKEKTDKLAEKLKTNSNLKNELIEYFPIASKSDKGTCMEALELVTKDDPCFIESCFDFVLEHINDTIPRVKWESSRVVANIASKYPVKAYKAVPGLVINAKDEGTVVKWSAASALAEISKHNPGSRETLMPIFKNIIKKEKNNGVQKIYIKALEKMKKKMTA